MKERLENLQLNLSKAVLLMHSFRFEEATELMVEIEDEMLQILHELRSI